MGLILPVHITSASLVRKPVVQFKIHIQIHTVHFGINLLIRPYRKNTTNGILHAGRNFVDEIFIDGKIRIHGKLKTLQNVKFHISDQVELMTDFVF